MAAMTTVLTVFNTDNNVVTYTTTGHTPQEPRLVIQKRKVASSVDGVSETSVKGVYGTTDSAGDVLPQKHSIEVIVRGPVKGDAADATALLTMMRDVIASDEMTNTASTQENLK